MEDAKSGRIGKQNESYDPYLLSSFICATHYIECSRIASPFIRAPDEVLVELYFGRTALIIPENRKGADALIPVRSVGSSPSASKYSVIFRAVMGMRVMRTRRLGNDPVDIFSRSRRTVKVRCIRMCMHLGADTSQTAVRPPVTSHLTASDYALAVFELTADVYPCLDFEEQGLDMGRAGANIDICAHMRRFPRCCL